MAHAQKPDFVFPRNGRVHLNRLGCQFSRLLAAEVCASAWVMLDRPRSEVAWEYWLPTPFASFLFTSPPVRHRVPPGCERALQAGRLRIRFPMGSLDFSLTYPSGRTVAPVDSASNRNGYQGYLLGDKGGRCVGLTLPPSCANYLKFWLLQPPGTL